MNLNIKHKHQIRGWGIHPEAGRKTSDLAVCRQLMTHFLIKSFGSNCSAASLSVQLSVQLSCRCRHPCRCDFIFQNIFACCRCLPLLLLVFDV